MNLFVYSIFLVFVYPLSFLPFSILYVVSDIFSAILFHVIKYRRKIVFMNLKHAFPEKLEKEIKVIAKRYYKNLADVVVENIKLLTISEKETLRRCRFVNPELMNKLKNDAHTVVGLSSHVANWELGGLSLSLHSDLLVYGVYKPLSNKYFEKLINRMRQKFGLVLVEMDETIRTILSLKEEPALTIFIADQTPLDRKTSYWTMFFNQDTPFYSVPEKIANKLHSPVIYFDMTRIKRGYYQIEIIPVCNTGVEGPNQNITENYARLLESVIRKKPEQWLWSHRRWKRTRHPSTEQTPLTT